MYRGKCCFKFGECDDLYDMHNVTYAAYLHQCILHTPIL